MKLTLALCCIVLLASGCQLMPYGCKGEIILGSGGKIDCQQESNDGDN